MKRISLIFVSAFLLFFCEESEIDDGGLLAHFWETRLSVLPDIGTNKTIFQPDIIAVLDDDTARIGSDLQVRVDYNNDGLADTDWLDSIPSTDSYATRGKYYLNFELKDTTGYIFSARCSIYVQELIQITSTNISGYSQGNIDWSRDGTNRIAFDMYGADSGGNQNIYYVEYPNGTAVKVSSNPNPGQYHFDQFPEWSPDGEKIACYSSNGLDLIDVNTGQRANIDISGYYIMLSWSPDGRWLAYWDGQNTLLYDFTTGTSSTLIDEDRIVAWSPDGNKLALGSGSWPDLSLQIMDFETQSLLDEYSVPGFGSKLDWSPDGRWISLGFTNDVGFLFNTETETIHSFKPDGLIRTWFPGWSGDGSQIAFEAKVNLVGEWESIWALDFPEDF